MTSRTAALIVDVHPSTIKRHCNNGQLEYDRTGGGHRRISPAQLADFLHGHQPTHILHGVGAELEYFLEGLRSQLQQNDESLLVDVLFKTALAGHERAFHAMIQHLLVVHPRDAVVYGRILLRLLREVEYRYDRTDLTIGEEHRISQIIRDTCTRLYLRCLAEVPTSDRQVIIGCAERDRHDVSALLCRLVFAQHGWRVRYLGADVPNEEFRREQIRWCADLVCISRTLPSGPGEDHNLLQSLLLPDRDSISFRVLLGGAWSDWAVAYARRSSDLTFMQSLGEIDRALRDGAL